MEPADLFVTIVRNFFAPVFVCQIGFYFIYQIIIAVVQHQIFIGSKKLRNFRLVIGNEKTATAKYVKNAERKSLTDRF